MMALSFWLELRRTLLSWFFTFYFQSVGITGMWVLGFSYKWNQPVDDMLKLASITSTFEVHPCCGIYQKFIPFYCQIPFCGYSHFYPFISWGSRLFLLWHSDESMWLCEQVICGHVFSSSLGIYLEIALLGHTVTLNLKFWQLPNCFPKGLLHFTWSAAMCGNPSNAPKQTESKAQRSVLERLEQMASAQKILSPEILSRQVVPSHSCRILVVKEWTSDLAACAWELLKM